MQDLKNKIVCITGASSGIGEACARQFAALGASLLLCARRLAILEGLAEQLRGTYGVSVYTVELDVRDRGAVESLIASLPEQWQSIDILVNNAGLAAGLATIQDGDADDWDVMIDTNVKGLLYMTQAVLPRMIAKDQGHIINIGSIAGHSVYPKGVVYCATKWAVNGISQGLRMDLLGTQIRVSSVDPGAVETNFSRVRFKGDEARATAVYAGMTPLTADDIADAVVYCATRPPHVNVNDMIVLPTDQAAATMVHRRA